MWIGTAKSACEIAHIDDHDDGDAVNVIAGRWIAVTCEHKGALLRVESHCLCLSAFMRGESVLKIVVRRSWR